MASSNRVKKIRKTQGTDFKESACSPLSGKDGKNTTCMTGKHLIELAQLWNKRHTDYPIESESPREIWRFFKKVFSSSCSSERCWIKNKMFGAGIDNDLLNELNELYAPDAPSEWKKNPRTWLNSMDIVSVMQQYEDRYSCFKFIGPSPIDFDRVITSSNGTKECVWDELCKFNINKQGTKTKIGVIFNTDPHNKPGEHWVSLFIDTKKRLIVYFDSAGSKIPPEVSRFIERIQKQIQTSNTPDQPEYNVIINKIAHQKKNTECGMYSLYFIIQMLKTGDVKQFTDTKRIIKDEEMEELRNEYFN